jgi:hypothetical protein
LIAENFRASRKHQKRLKQFRSSERVGVMAAAKKRRVKDTKKLTFPFFWSKTMSSGICFSQVVDTLIDMTANVVCYIQF